MGLPKVQHCSQVFADGDYQQSLLERALQFVTDVPLQFLSLLLDDQARLCECLYVAAFTARTANLQHTGYCCVTMGIVCAGILQTSIGRLKLGAGSQGPICAAGLDAWRRRLEQRVFQTIGRCRLEQMFDIVVAYPDSRPAIDDVRQCLSRASLNAAFVTSFTQAIRQRLLHAGAEAVPHEAYPVSS